MAQLNLVDRAGLQLPQSRPGRCMNCIVYGDAELTLKRCPTCPDDPEIIVLHERKSTKISDLPDGNYLIISSRFLYPTAPIVDRDKLDERITKLGYTDSEVKVEGPFRFLRLTPGRGK